MTFYLIITRFKGVPPTPSVTYSQRQMHKVVRSARENGARTRVYKGICDGRLKVALEPFRVKRQA